MLLTLRYNYTKCVSVIIKEEEFIKLREGNREELKWGEEGKQK